MFKDNILRLHGIPTTIILDGGRIFESDFWRSVLIGLGTKPNFTTALHPQSDGQTEQVNQVLNNYLRTYANNKLNNWCNN
jgi:hypothetical protein